MTERVAETTAHRLRARLARAQRDGRLPSVVAGVVRGGTLVWADGYGDVPGPDPADVQYRIGSITKTLTAVLVHQLVGEGRLSLDVAVGDVLDELAGAPYGSASVRRLLSHSSGMQAEPVGDWWERSAGVDLAELAARHAAAEPVLVPGAQFHYSNLGFGLLGELVARVSDTPWRDLVEHRVTRPLGMNRTTYLPDGGVAARGWSVHPWAGTLTPEPHTDTGAMAPAGQLWSTVRDLAAYSAFLLDGHPDVLDRDALLRAAHPQAGDQADQLTGAYGLGFQLMRAGSRALVGHGGSMPGFLAGCFVDRDRGTGAVVLANATTGLAGDLLTGLLEELEDCEPTVVAPWRPAPGVPEALAALLGTWHWGNTHFTFTLEGDEVVARTGGREKWRFAEADGRVLGTRGYHTGEEVHVARRDDGSVSHLEIATFVLTRTPYDPQAPIPGGAPPADEGPVRPW